MRELTLEQVATLAQAAGFDLSSAELVDVMHQLNVIIAGVEKAQHPDLDAIDPLPILTEGEVDDARP